MHFSCLARLGTVSLRFAPSWLSTGAAAHPPRAQRGSPHASASWSRLEYQDADSLRTARSRSRPRRGCRAPSDRRQHSGVYRQLQQLPRQDGVHSCTALSRPSSNRQKAGLPTVPGEPARHADDGDCGFGPRLINEHLSRVSCSTSPLPLIRPPSGLRTPSRTPLRRFSGD